MALLIVCTMVLACTGGCIKKNNERYYFDTEYFKCVSVSEDSETTAIIGLTEKGKEQEILVFPEKLNGYIVDQIGSSFYPVYSTGLLKTYIVDVSNAKKIYILSPLNSKYDVRINGFQEGCQIILLGGNAACLGSSVFPQYGYTKNDVLPLSIFVTHSYLINNEKFISDRHYSGNTFAANINFYLNYGDERPYFIDSYNKDALYVLPDTPTQIGYLFNGWYMESDYINIWDEEYPDSQEKVLNLYAKWLEA